MERRRAGLVDIDIFYHIVVEADYPWPDSASDAAHFLGWVGGRLVFPERSHGSDFPSE